MPLLNIRMSEHRSYLPKPCQPRHLSHRPLWLRVAQKYEATRHS